MEYISKKENTKREITQAFWEIYKKKIFLKLEFTKFAKEQAIIEVLFMPIFKMFTKS